MTLPFQPGQSDYAVGTASVLNGSNVVNFTGAALTWVDAASGQTLQACQVGDRFIAAGVVYEIKAVNSATQIELEQVYDWINNAAIAYKIRRASYPSSAALTAAVQALLAQGTDSAPDASRTIDDSTARLKLRLDTFKAKLSVAAYSGGVLQSLIDALSIDPATGAVSFPSGLVLPAPGFKNRLINGNFEIWQRGTSFSVASGTQSYVADRWFGYNSLGVSATFSKVTAPAGFVGQSAMNITATGVGAGNSFQLRQRLESASTFDLDTVSSTLTFDVNASTSAGSLSGIVYLAFNTAADNATYSANSAYIGFAVPVGSGRVTVPLTAAQMAGAKYGMDIGILFVQNTSTGNPNITVGAVQLENGAVANPFEFRPLPVVLAMCQRYFERIRLSGLVGQVVATNGVNLAAQWRVTKRAAPSLTLLKTTYYASSGSGYDLMVAGAWATGGGISLSAWPVGVGGGIIGLVGFAGLTVGQTAVGNADADFVDVNSEL